MMDGTWEGYFYPETVNPWGQGALINKFGVRDEKVLRELEYLETAQRAPEVREGAVHIERTFDADHLRAIHRHLFGNVYPWAGEFRTVDFGKGGDLAFALVGDDVELGEGYVEDYLAEVQDYVTHANWADMSRSEFVGHSATVLAAVNQAHPFREGNGRTQKLFLEHVAEQSPFSFNEFDGINVDSWNAASQASRPTVDRPYIEPQALLSVLDAAVVERDAQELADQAFPQRVNQLGMNAAMSYLRPGNGPRSSGAASHQGEPYRGYGQEYGSGAGIER